MLDTTHITAKAGLGSLLGAAASITCLTIDALMHSLERPGPVIKLYGVLANKSTSSGGPTKHRSVCTVTRDRAREPSTQEASRS